MQARRRLSALALVLSLGLAHAQEASSAEEALVPFERFTLDNGLTLLVHEDAKAPVVAVNVWYHVGSKDEPEGRTGFAHLFEHLMFQGTENHPAEYLPTLIGAGATTINGTTNVDRTNYFQTVPVNALDLALFMESERMGHLLGAVTQEALDAQRAVVQNEKRQAENQPFGRVRAIVAEHAYPPDHPYAHDVFGSMEDLEAATLEDVRAWFRTHYGPNDAVLVVAGDVEADAVRAKVERYFGDIEPGPSPARTTARPAPLEHERRRVLHDRVPEPRLYQVWNVPAWRERDTMHLELVASLLADGRASRLHRALVRTGLATRVDARVEPGELGSQLWIDASPAPGTDLAAVEAAIDEVLASLAQEGPDPAEVARVQARLESDLLRGLQSVGGFGGKSDLLAMNEVLAGDAARLDERFDAYATATAGDLRDAVRTWLGDGAFVLEVRPEPALASRSGGVDRSSLPPVGDPPEGAFPDVQRERLANGLEVVLLERHALPLVEARLLVDAGVAADPPDAPGTATLAASALVEGTARRGGLELAEAFDALGARIGAGNTLDGTHVVLSTLRRTLPESLALLAEVALEPAFPVEQVERLKREQIAAIARESAQPTALALSVLPELVYGEAHPYGTSWTGNGEPEAVAALDAADLRAFHETWFRPQSATLLVVGDVTMDELRPLVEEAFGAWSGGEAPRKDLTAPPQREEGPVIHLLDRPGSVQSLVLAAQPLPHVEVEEEAELTLLNAILGGSYASRTNRNLRQEKGWTYGAYTLVPDARGTRLLLAYAPVQNDRTAEALAELDREIRGIVGAAPVTAEELALARQEQAAGLPGTWETLGAVATTGARLVQLGLPDDYYDGYADELTSAGVDDLRALAGRTIRPDELVWVVVGDRAVVEEPLRALGIGEVRILEP